MPEIFIMYEWNDEWGLEMKCWMELLILAESPLLESVKTSPDSPQPLFLTLNSCILSPYFNETHFQLWESQLVNRSKWHCPRESRTEEDVAIVINFSGHLTTFRAISGFPRRFESCSHLSTWKDHTLWTPFITFRECKFWEFYTYRIHRPSMEG